MADRALGNPLGNPLGLARVITPPAPPAPPAPVLEVQSGLYFGATGAPNRTTINFPSPIDLNRTVIIVDHMNGQAGNYYGLIGLDSNKMVFESASSPASGVWPGFSWKALTIPGVKQVYRISVSLPSGYASAASADLPAGIDQTKCFVIPILFSTNRTNSHNNDVIAYVGNGKVTINRGPSTTTRVDVTYLCQVVELE